MVVGNVIAVIDIGSTKVSCCIVDVFDDTDFSVLGTGCCMCIGVEDGRIVNVEHVSKAISNAVEAAEKMAKLRIKEAYVSVFGSTVVSDIVNVAKRICGRKVTISDINDLYTKANTSAFLLEQEEYEVLYKLPLTYIVDSKLMNKKPIGIVCETIGMSINVVLVQKKHIHNIVVCMDMCHLDFAGVVPSDLAAGWGVLDADFNQKNVIVVDVGGVYSSISFFYNGRFCGSESVQFGGVNITQAIAQNLGLSFAIAERMKTLHGTSYVSVGDENELIYVPIVEGKQVVDLQKITKQELNNIVQTNVEIIFTKILDKIKFSSFSDNFSDDIVITGGGSQLTGFEDAAKAFFRQNIVVKNGGDSFMGNACQLCNDFAVCLGMIRRIQFDIERTKEKRINWGKKLFNNLLKKFYF